MGWLATTDSNHHQSTCAPQQPPRIGGKPAPQSAFVSPMPGAVSTTASVARRQAPTADAAHHTIATDANVSKPATAAAVPDQPFARTTLKRPRGTSSPMGMGMGLDTGKRASTACPTPASAHTASGQVLVRTDRESNGGTQGAVTGLTHMALQKHNQLQAGLSAQPAGPRTDGTDSQGMAQQVSELLLDEQLLACD